MRKRQLRSASGPEIRLLIADDDSNFIAALQRFCDSSNIDVVAAADGQEALERMDDGVSVALLDLSMPRVTGLECLKAIRKRFPLTQVIIMSGRSGVTEVIAAMKLGAFWYLTKPFDRDELIALVERAHAHYTLTQTNRQLSGEVGQLAGGTNFLGKSSSIRDLLKKAEKIADLDSTVLITGETGTGKSTLARLIHQHSNRRSKPFVALNCSAIPRDLLEAELFGHERGAFTGAFSARQGCIEQAEGGTLFLDEIADLPLELQPKLLQFLQESTTRRLGGGRERKINVRVIAATNRKLESLVEKQAFREDLFYRLNVLAIAIPPLRSRTEDIPMLADHILARISARRNHAPYYLSEDALTQLRAHIWPGNVRELENVLDRATAFAESPLLNSVDIPIDSVVKLPATEATDIVCIDGMTLDEIERQVIERTLQRFKGNQTQTARVLGISSKSVYNKIQKFGL